MGHQVKLAKIVLVPVDGIYSVGLSTPKSAPQLGSAFQISLNQMDNIPFA